MRSLRTHFVGALAVIGALLSALLAAHATAPSWWTSSGVIDAQAPDDDYQAANAGQLKSIATKAYSEMEDALPQFGGAGAAVEDRVAEFTQDGNYEAINQGQLKYVAQPFYARLIEIGYCPDYPWASGTPDDWSLINIGQLKNIFSFDLTRDLDADEMPDWWEEFHQVANPTDDPDQDGLDNVAEFTAGADPWNDDTDGDGLVDGWEVANQLDPKDDGYVDPSQGADGDPDGDGIPNSAEQDLGADPHSADEIEDVGPNDHGFAFVYKLAVASRTKEEGEGAFDQPAAPLPKLYYLHYEYTLSKLSCEEGADTQYTHATIDYTPSECKREYSHNNINTFPCPPPPNDPAQISRNEVTTTCTDADGTSVRDTQYCGNPSSGGTTPITGCNIVRPSQPSWTLLSENILASETHRAYDNGECTYTVDEALSTLYGNDKLDSVARGNIAAASTVLDSMSWGQKVSTGCSGVGTPTAIVPGDEECAKKVLSDRETKVDLQKLRYGFQVDTVDNVIYRCRIVEVWQDGTASDPISFNEPKPYYVRGNGARKTVSNSDMTIEPPENDGRRWPLCYRIGMIRPDDQQQHRYYHNVFDGAYPGVCTVTCTVQIAPDNSQVKDALVGSVLWTITPVSGSTLSWENGTSQEGIGEYIAGVWEERAFYTLLPQQNSAFGLKNVHVSIGELGFSSVGKTAVFYTTTAKNHPGPGSGVTPNWFSYWHQTSANYGDPGYEEALVAPTFGRTVYAGNHWEAHLGRDVYQPTTRYGDVDSIDHYANTSRHEAVHVADGGVWWPNGYQAAADLDGDWIPDSVEASLGYKNYLWDTDGDRDRDCEDHAYDNQAHWDTGSQDHNDWSDLGHQHMLNYTEY